MEGLISQAGAAPAAAGAAPAVTEEQGGQSASAEEQQWYDAVQQAGAEILFDNDEASAYVVKMLDKNEPGLSAGRAAAEVMIRIDDGMDGEVPDAVVLPASEELLDHVLDIGEAARVFKRSPELEEEAAQAMVARLAEEYGVDEADFQSAQQAAQGVM